MRVAAQSQRREQERHNALLAATISTGVASWPVRLRNISAHGACIESDTKIDVVTTVFLDRGALQAAGEVVWRREGAFGIKFSTAIVLEQWIKLRTEAAVEPAPAQPPPCSSADAEVISGRITEEITYVARMIAHAAEMLSRDPILRIRHADRLQELCICETMLNELGPRLITTT